MLNEGKWIGLIPVEGLGLAGGILRGGLRGGLAGAFLRVGRKARLMGHSCGRAGRRAWRGIPGGGPESAPDGGIPPGGPGGPPGGGIPPGGPEVRLAGHSSGWAGRSAWCGALRRTFRLWREHRVSKRVSKKRVCKRQRTRSSPAFEQEAGSVSYEGKRIRIHTSAPEAPAPKGAPGGGPPGGPPGGPAEPGTPGPPPDCEKGSV